MLDIKLIRENPEKINELLKRRNPALSIDEVIKIDEERRKIQTQADELRARRKNESQKIGMMKKNGENTDEIQEDVRKLGDEIKALEEVQNQLDQKQRDVLLHIPNIPDESTPIGKSEDDNVVVSTWGEPTKFDFDFKAHWDICEEKGIVDFERGVRLSQSRFILYRGKGARLERAIINFFLDEHTQNEGYEEILPPFMANSATMTGTGQLPKFKEDMYKCENEDLYLIPTAEVTVNNIYAGEILSEDEKIRDGHIAKENDLADYFEETVKDVKDVSIAVNFITTSILSTLNKLEITIEELVVTPSMLSSLINLVSSDKLSLDHAKKILYKAIELKTDPIKLIEKENLSQINDKDELIKYIKIEFDKYPNQVEQYIKEDNLSVINFFMGKVMSSTKRQANPNMTRELIKEELERMKKND